MVLWHTLLGNFASRRVAWKAGFRIAADPVWAAGPPAGGSRPEQVWAGRLLPGEAMEPATRWLTAPTIEGDGIRLRAFRDEDAGSMPVEHDDAIRSYSAGLPTRDSFDDWLLAQRSRSAAGNTLTCAVADATTDRAARRRRHRPPRRAPLRGHGDPRLLAAARRARWWRGGEGARAAHPVCLATRRRRRAGPLPAHRRLRGRQPGVGSGAAASGVRARRYRATGHPGRRVGRRRPGVRPAGDRRPRRPTGPAGPAPGDRDRAVPPAPLDVPGRPRRGRGSRPSEPALHAAGRPPRRGDVPHVAAPAGARARTATSTSTGRSPTARPTTPSAT